MSTTAQPVTLTDRATSETLAATLVRESRPGPAGGVGAVSCDAPASGDGVPRGLLRNLLNHRRWSRWR